MWRLVTTAAAVADARECVRLVLTGLPSLVPCRLTGWAVPSAGGEWELTLFGRDEASPEREGSDRDPTLRTRLLDLASGCARRECLEEWRPERAEEAEEEPDRWIAVPVRSLSRTYGVLLMECVRPPGRRGREHLRRAAEYLAMRLEDLARVGSSPPPGA